MCEQQHPVDKLQSNCVVIGGMKWTLKLTHCSSVICNGFESQTNKMQIVGGYQAMDKASPLAFRQALMSK